MKPDYDKTLKPPMDHVEHLADGGMACMHCGGAVDREGYSMGGVAGDHEDVDSGEFDFDDSEESGQAEAAEKVSMDGFARALRHRGGR